jgi:hypothetical protein
MKSWTTSAVRLRIQETGGRPGPTEQLFRGGLRLGGEEGPGCKARSWLTVAMNGDDQGVDRMGRERRHGVQPRTGTRERSPPLVAQRVLKLTALTTVGKPRKPSRESTGRLQSKPELGDIMKKAIGYLALVVFAASSAGTALAGIVDTPLPATLPTL